MKIEYYNDPWNHYQVTDFLTEEEFNIIKDYHIKNVRPPKEGRNVFPSRLISEEIRGILSPRMHELAAQVDPKHDNSDCVINIEMHTIQPDWEYPVHQDIPLKNITFVLDISAEGNGTRLYEREDGPIVKTMPWIVNGGGGFIRSDSTWHSFDTHGGTEPRRTVILNIMNIFKANEDSNIK
jgi:hypothetical protein